jgi:predicted aminopeptidase
MARYQPISELIEAPATPQRLKERLTDVLAMRAFAIHQLGLPDNGSYRSYVELERPYVVWSVFATPEFSLTPHTDCFFVVGCLSYRGFFAKSAAERYAAQLRGQSYDVYIAGVTAYSTLGWFADPVLSTLLQGSEARLARLIFHELAHQKLYIDDATDFNEGFAVTVEIEGVQRWFRDDPPALQVLRQDLCREEEFRRLIETARERLATLYINHRGAMTLRAEKQEILSDLQATYAQLREGRWRDYAGYDQWFAHRLNNAQLAAVDIYRRHVPAFQRLLHEMKGNLQAFYAAAARLGELPPEVREAQLRRLALQAKDSPPMICEVRTRQELANVPTPY